MRDARHPTSPSANQATRRCWKIERNGPVIVPKMLQIPFQNIAKMEAGAPYFEAQRVLGYP